MTGSRSRARRVVRALLSSLLLGSPPACDGLESAGPESLVTLRQRSDTNLVFVLADTLRPDHLGSYGYERPTSPVLDGLARNGVRFERVIGASSWTKPAVVSLFTARHPPAHGVVRATHVVPDGATLAAEVLRDAGFQTAALVRNHWVTRAFGLDQGVEAFFQFKPDVVHPGGGKPRKTGFWRDADVVDMASQLLEQYRDERFFLYLHLMDVHDFELYPSEEVFGTGEIERYDNAVRSLDREIGRLVQKLEDLDLREKTLLVVTSDHGEALNEHGRKGHGLTLFGEEIHVPLLLSPPFRLEPGLVVEQAAATVDIFPTLLDLLGVEPLPGASGRSLVAAMTTPPGGTHGTPAAVSHLDRSWGALTGEPRPMAAVTQGRFRLIQNVGGPSDVALFDLVADPGERRDLSQAQPEVRDALQARLEDAVVEREVWGAPPHHELDARSLELLKGIGYVID